MKEISKKELTEAFKKWRPDQDVPEMLEDCVIRLLQKGSDYTLAGRYIVGSSDTLYIYSYRMVRVDNNTGDRQEQVARTDVNIFMENDVQRMIKVSHAMSYYHKGLIEDAKERI